ncbi:hypothetical protein HAX54_006312, partial [Datura stramonium]|nr:hypothetical protein [Datura stramonium]
AMAYNRDRGKTEARPVTAPARDKALTDILHCMLGFLKGMIQWSILPSTPCDSQARVGGQTPDHVVAQ